ncbi:ABC transporter permease [Thiorhodococcus mannitoliphagus]|uniref:ABC transporter permease n=1 Tax=Thiorhodococcus mannitoliphagus TaxID=329406 RepID=A0A6P1DSC4_9GAMM|nr:ABC transporter permease [Thiorhodococcus mannitoliphagus]NEX20729.1 ABC transporter permease [Thiorhodococcus mannitoliphagus]
MRALLTSAHKELRLLARDYAGLLVLFLMPVTLVVVITLVQENILQLSGQRPTEICVQDDDQGPFAHGLTAYLQTGKLEAVPWTGSADELRQAVTAGTCQAALILEQGASARLQQQIDRQLAGDATSKSPSLALDLLFDPATMVGFRAGIFARVQMAAQATELEMKATRLGARLTAQAGAGTPAGNGSGEDLRALFSRSLTTIAEQSGHSSQSSMDEILNPVDRNVPAWALFGMFFTAIPIAGTILTERQSGVALRLTAMPVSPISLLAGKMFAYLGVCVVQFILIALVGIYLFPHLGLQAFSLPINPLSLLLPVCASSLAACGFGVCLGSVCRSYEQASTLGATIVVAAAAMGGIMVPVYAMPPLMQQLSILSPLSWAITCFSDLLIRGNPWESTLPDLGRLVAFSAVMLIISWKRAYR